MGGIARVKHDRRLAGSELWGLTSCRAALLLRLKPEAVTGWRKKCGRILCVGSRAASLSIDSCLGCLAACNKRT